MIPGTLVLFVVEVNTAVLTATEFKGGDSAGTGVAASQQVEQTEQWTPVLPQPSKPREQYG